MPIDIELIVITIEGIIFTFVKTFSVPLRSSIRNELFNRKFGELLVLLISRHHGLHTFQGELLGILILI